MIYFNIYVMKYIKLFEGLETYQEIEMEEFGNIYWSYDKHAVYTTYELDKLKSKPYSLIIAGENHDKARPSILDRRLLIDSREGSFLSDVQIIKCKDDWFYVKKRRASWDRNFYKCDQFDGLLDCLKKEIKLG